MAKGFWVLDKNLGINEQGNPSTVSESGHVLQSLNTSWATDGVLSLRRGTDPISLTSSGFTGDVKWGGRHVTNTASEELWAAANNAGTAALAHRVAGTWSAVTYSDTVVVADLLYHHSATLDGSLYLAYNSDVNRLHVWDGTALRRVGITKPAALTVANSAAGGAYPATARRYRTSQRIYDASLNILAESELSDAVSFTPSGINAAATITKSTTIDSATHWVIWGLISTLGDTYDLYENIAVLAVGTTTYDDTTNPASYVGDFPQELGVNIPPPAAKFIITDGARLIMANSWETTAAAGQTVPKANRVWFSRVQGTSDLGDLESVPNSLTRDYHLDIGDMGPVTGLAGPLYGDIYVFKQRSTWKMVPTGDVTTPYRAVIVSETIGALDQRLISAMGDIAIAFADEYTVYLVGGDSAPNVISTPISLSLAYAPMVAATSFLAYDQTDQKLVVCRSTGAGFHLDVQKSRWGELIYGGVTTVNRGVMVANAAGSQRLHLVGLLVGNASMIYATGSATQQDNGAGGTSFPGTVVARFVPSPGCLAMVYAPTIWYRAPEAAGTATITVTYLRHDGQSSPTGVFTLTPTSTNAAGSGLFKVGVMTLDGLAMADAQVVDVTLSLTQLGGASASPTVTIDRVVIPYEEADVVSR